MIIGIDPDCRQLAYAALDGDHDPVVGTVQRSNRVGRILDGYDAALTAFVRRAQERGAVLHIEGIFCQNPKTHAALAEVAGELKRAARMHSVPVEVVSATAWHAAILGVTRGRDRLKAAAAAHAHDLTGRDDLTEHEADAVCIAEYGKTPRMPRERRSHAS